jgi:hypothetical protein
MATDKKHIAVYLAPEVELALIAFCQEKDLISKKGTMFSAGVNAALAQFFGIVDTRASNIPIATGNILTDTGNIPCKSSGNIPIYPSNIPLETNNIPQETDNIPIATGNILTDTGNIPYKSIGNIPIYPSNIPVESLAMEGLPGKSQT